MIEGWPFDEPITDIEMKSAATTIIGVSLLVSSLGCAMCDSSLDTNYAAFGGLFERTDQHGRIGSTFSPHQPTVGRIGSITPVDPEVSAHDRPRDLSEDNGIPSDPMEGTPQDNSGFGPSDDSPGNNEIPDFNSGDFEDLLDEIPGGETDVPFPGDVKAGPFEIDLESPSPIQPVTYLESAEAEPVDNAIFSLADRVAEIAIDGRTEIVSETDLD